MTRLSVCIPSFPQRSGTTLPRLIDALNAQMVDDDAELICMIDNERYSIGEKLNIMYGLAHGEFVSVVADDDMVSDDYVAQLLDAIDRVPDATVICFDCAYYVDGEPAGTIKESHLYDEKHTHGIMYRKPSDKMCWNREFMLANPHMDNWQTSDREFAMRVCDKIEIEARVDEILYYFYYDGNNPKGKRYREMLDKKYHKRTA